MSITTSVYALPSIGIGSMYDVFTPDTQSLTKRVYNTGTSTAFVRVDVLEINPEDKGISIESPQKTIDGNKLEKDRLIVSPLRLIIPPSGFQSVRMIWPGEREKERYFRVRFTPVLPQDNDGFEMNKDAIEKYKKEALDIGVNVLTGYGSIVIVQPIDPIFNTVMNKSNGHIKVINNGNATIVLEDIRYCNLNSIDCDISTRQFILPGKTFNL
ncbi:hypothetical protein, partial [Providencia rettgeri]|uniref:hypothetical protein n=2 Tax=Morganellaceae TaxID=1903414 RepID=UPI001FF75BE0